MSWTSFHTESERLADAAHEALAHRDGSRAAELFEQAALLEEKAFNAIGPDKPRTLGVTAVSTVALWYKAGKLDDAAQLAHRASAMHGMPPFALHDLRELLQSIWNEQAQRAAGVSFVPGQVVVSVKGGEVVSGGAPLDVVLDKVQIVQSLFYRTAEFLNDLPLRKHGPPSRELQARCRPWLFQSVPGSYQFAVAIQKPAQHEMFPAGDPGPEVLTETFLSILRTAGEDPVEAFKSVVPKEEYRSTFLKMARNLAPTGKVVEKVEIRGTGDRTPIMLSSGSRKLISDSLRGPPSGRQPAQALLGEEIELTGILRALHLDDDWIEVTVSGGHQRVDGVGDVVDDLIGPMVNREVRVRVRKGRRGRLLFVDIEQEE
jgi:hypothetical protein